MKVKIGNKVYDSEKEPIMLILSDEDKKNMSQMLPKSRKYCSYPENESPDKIRKWMQEELL